MADKYISKIKVGSESYQLKDVDWWDVKANVAAIADIASIASTEELAAKINEILSKFRPSVPPSYLTFTANTPGSTVSMTTYGTAPSVTLETSVDDGATWQAFTVGTTTITLAGSGDKVQFRAGTSGNAALGSGSGWNYFSISGSVAASGNANSLLDQTLSGDSVGAYAFYALFYACAGLTSAPELPATTLANSCYNGMFAECTALTAAPVLPATTMAEKCYSDMFSSCIALATAPALPATVLADECYARMFNECVALTAAPALPATTLSAKCYYSMFQDCQALTTAPVLPATTLLNNCYYSMFDGCTALNYVETQQSDFNGCNNWLPDNHGTFKCKSSLVIPATRTTSDVPPNWTIDATL